MAIDKTVFPIILYQISSNLLFILSIAMQLESFA